MQWSRAVLSDHGQALREMQWGDIEAIAWAEKHYRDTGRWTTRRWRVEDTPGGNSRLLTHSEALKRMAEYGGRLCELIPNRKHYKYLCYSTDRVSVFNDKE